MTPRERDMLQFAVWIISSDAILAIAFDDIDVIREPSEVQFGYAHSEWVELWNKILGNKL